MRQQFQVLPGLSDPVADAAAPAPLPFLATANDVRGVVHYLRKRPDGVTLGEAVDAVKKQSFEPGKLATYELLGITVRNGDRFKLSQLGWEMARQLEPEAEAFRALLNNVEPYRAVLEWACRKKLDVITHPEVAAHWREHYPESLGISTPKMVEGHVICFFQLCQAAALGTHVIGKKGQPTRLRLDRDELPIHSGSVFAARFTEAPPRRSGESAGRAVAAASHCHQSPAELTPARTLRVRRVFVSCGGETTEIAERIGTTLDFADIRSHIVARTSQDASMMAPVAAHLMRGCEAGVIVVGRDDIVREGTGADVPRRSLQTVIGAASVLYDRRVLLVWDSRTPVPSDLAGLPRCGYERAGPSWETGLEIMKAVKIFNDDSA